MSYVSLIADELEVSVLEQEFKPEGVLLADYFGGAMNWSKFEFEFESSQVDLSSMDVMPAIGLMALV